MYWYDASHPDVFYMPTTVCEAIELLEGAFETIENAWRRAKELDAEDPPNVSVVRKPIGLAIAFEDPPEGEDGALNQHVVWRPQTLIWRSYNRAERAPHFPVFHEQVQRNISTAVQFLVPVCEEAHFSADPLYELIAWGAPYSRKRFRKARVLIAKLRCRYGIPGKNFLGMPGVVTIPLHDDFVTLDQAAALVNRTKRSLSAYRGKGLPDPDVRGGRGKPHEWHWSTLRPFLLTFRPNLPDRFPSHLLRLPARNQ